MSIKRKPDESFEQYKKRRLMYNTMDKQLLKGSFTLSPTKVFIIDGKSTTLNRKQRRELGVK
jgi:hypothetical protein